MSDTKTKNLCTVTAGTVSDATNFIVEKNKELLRVPQSDVIKTKLSDMTVLDLYNLLNGSEANAEVNAQTFMNTLADMVANKLLKKTQLINNFLATEAGVGALDALAGATLKTQIDKVNGDLQEIYDSDSIPYATDLLTIPFGKMHKYSPDTLNIPVSGQYGVAFKFGNDTGKIGSGQWEYIIAYSTENPPRTYIKNKVNTGNWTGWSSYVRNSDFKATTVSGSYKCTSAETYEYTGTSITVPACMVYFAIGSVEWDSQRAAGIALSNSSTSLSYIYAITETNSSAPAGKALCIGTGAATLYLWEKRNNIPVKANTNSITVITIG